MVIGAGGFGREALDVALAINTASAELKWEIVGVADDSPSERNLARLAARGVAYLGPVDVLNGSEPSTFVAIGVGAPAARRRVFGQVETMGLTQASLVHPTAIMGSQVVLGKGVIVCGGVSIGTNVSLGRAVHLNPNAVIGHDAWLEDFVSINPNATISGECRIGSAALVGASAVVLQALTIAGGALVGAGACVTRSVEADVTVVGIPARNHPTVSEGSQT